jgi:hypothetical protein
MPTKSDWEREKELKNTMKYYGKAIQDAEERLARGEKAYPGGEKISFLLSVFRWVFSKSKEELDDRRKADEYDKNK